MLQRMQLMFDSETKADLLYLSQATNRSMSDLVREFVAEKAKVEKKKIARKNKENIHPAQALLDMAKEAEEIEKKYSTSGPIDGSINHDHYIYGTPKKKAL